MSRRESGAEEDVSAIAKTDFGIWIAPRDAVKPANIRHGHHFAAHRRIRGAIDQRAMKIVISILGRFVARGRLLASEQPGAVYTPIRGNVSFRWATDEICECLPRKRGGKPMIGVGTTSGEIFLYEKRSNLQILRFPAPAGNRIWVVCPVAVQCRPKYPRISVD